MIQNDDESTTKSTKNGSFYSAEINHISMAMPPKRQHSNYHVRISLGPYVVSFFMQAICKLIPSGGNAILAVINRLIIVINSARTVSTKRKLTTRGIGEVPCGSIARTRPRPVMRI